MENDSDGANGYPSSEARHHGRVSALFVTPTRSSVTVPPIVTKEPPDARLDRH